MAAEGLMDLDYAITRVALGEDPDTVLHRLVEAGELVHPGRRDMLKQIAGAAVQAPLLRSIAVGAATQAITQAATAAVQHAVKPSFATHIDHPKAGTDEIIDHQELIAGAHNIFRKEHNSPIRVSSHEVPWSPWHPRPETVKEFDWKTHTGWHPDELMRKSRETGVTQMELLGHTKKTMTPDQFAQSLHPFEVPQHFEYYEEEPGRPASTRWRHTSDLHGLNVRTFRHPNAAHDVVSYDPDTSDWSRTVMHYATGQHEKHEWNTYTGKGHVSLYQHLEQDKGSDNRPLRVNVFEHPKTGEKYYERVHMQTSGMNPGHEGSVWSSVFRPDSPSRDHEGKPYHVVRSHSYGQAPDSEPDSVMATHRDTEAWEKVKGTHWKTHHEEHGDVMTFPADRSRGWDQSVIGNPDDPRYDHQKFMKEVASRSGGHYIIENPFHWGNLKAGEHSPLDKRGFDAMHVATDGKLTRFHVPFDPNDRDFKDADLSQDWSSSDAIRKKVIARHQSIQGPQWKHYKSAHSSVGMNIPSTHSWLWSEEGDLPVGEALKEPVSAHTALTKGTVKTVVHPSGKWEVHTGGVTPTTTHKVHPKDEYSRKYEQPEFDQVNFKLHSTGETPADLRKTLLGLKKELS